MNILFISNLSGNLFAGPNNSVPAQIQAQKKIDNVFWYNLNNIKREEWIDIGCFNLNDYPTGRLLDLPEPFSNPDIAVIEEFYCFPFCRIIKDIQRKGIPYVIVPRSEMTEQAQKKKRYKKIVGNILYFNKFARKAAAIQYLSKQEMLESCSQWGNKYHIIPNGIDVKTTNKKFSQTGIKAIYIGRYDKYQKGLDLLLDSISEMKDALRNSGFILDMYGVDQDGTMSYINSCLDTFQICDIVHVNGPVFGEEKKRILIDADVFFLTSRFEGMPMGLIEALSYGLPALVTTGTNMAEEIRNTYSGWASSNTTDGITDSIKKMLIDRSQFEMISNNCVKLAQQFSWDSIALKSHRMYEEITNGK